MADNHYDLGELVSVYVDFVDNAGDPQNPATVKLDLIYPGGRLVTLTYGGGGESASVNNPTTGRFDYDVDGSKPGTYAFRWYGVGTGQAAKKGKFTIDPWP